jgi:hypothetical protein
LSGYNDKDKLSMKVLAELHGDEMAIKILLQSPGGVGEGVVRGNQFTTRPLVKDLLMYLLYFGIGGEKNCCAKYIIQHLSGRKAGTSSSADSCLNHFVTKAKVVTTCIFELNFPHKSNVAEQAGINFVTTTGMQTNVRQSGAVGKHDFMYY